LKLNEFQNEAEIFLIVLLDSLKIHMTLEKLCTFIQSNQNPSNFLMRCDCMRSRRTKPISKWL